MTGLFEMASVPHIRTSNVLGNRPDRPSSDSLGYSGSSWRRDSGDRNKTNTDCVVMNGLRVDCDLSSNMQDYNSNKSLETMGEVDETCTVVDSDNIVSVQNNPFFKSFGIRTSHRDSRFEEVSKTPQVSSSLKENDSVFNDNDQEQEYHPGSGFVHKLLDKFSSLSAREERTYHHHPKRTTSLENLIADPSNKHLGLHKITKDDGLFTKSSRSVHSADSVNTESRVNHRVRPQKPVRVPVAPFKQDVYDADQEKNKIKSPRDSFEPADVKLGRTDIVIIENTSHPSNHDNNTGQMSPTPEQSNKVADIMNYKEDKLNKEELPKPNTVISVRNFFESKKAKRAPLPPSPVTTVSLVYPVSPTTAEPQPPPKRPLIPARPVLPVPKEIKPSSSVRSTDTVKPNSPRQTEQNHSLITSNSPRYNAKTVASVAPYRDETNDTNSASGSLIFTSKTPVKPTSVHSAAPGLVNKSEESTHSSENHFQISSKNEPPISSKTATEATLPGSLPVEEDEQKQEENICKTEAKTVEDGDSNEPIRGVPTFIANRRKKEAELRLGHQQNSFVTNRSSQEPEHSVHTGKHSQLDEVIESQKSSKSVSSSNTTDSVSNGTTELEAARRNIENARSKTQTQGVSMVFDSSQLKVKKRQPYVSSNNVPRLDLSSITNDVTQNGHFQEGYKPTEIKPCRIEFIGANVKLARSLLDKTNIKKGKISFDDDKTSMFEYPSEETLLDEYLTEHPEEREEMLLLPDINSESNESTDDDTPGTPRDTIAMNHMNMVSDIDEVIKSNTSLSHSGGLSSYRAKFTQDFQFGDLLNQPEPVKRVEPVPAEPADPDSLQMMPADVDETVTWSSGGTSDLLF